MRCSSTTWRRTRRCGRKFFDPRSASSMRPPHCRRACGPARAAGRETRGRKVPFISSWACHRDGAGDDHGALRNRRPGNIGVAGPGMAVKLRPSATKLEIASRDERDARLLQGAGLTAAAFDARLARDGDAVRLAEPTIRAGPAVRRAQRRRTSSCRPHVGQRRHAAPCHRRGRAGIEGHRRHRHDRDEIGLLIFRASRGCAVLSRRGTGRAPRRADPRAGGAQGAARRPGATQCARAGSSMRIARCLLLTERPPSTPTRSRQGATSAGAPC